MKPKEFKKYLIQVANHFHPYLKVKKVFNFDKKRPQATFKCYGETYMVRCFDGWINSRCFEICALEKPYIMSKRTGTLEECFQRFEKDIDYKKKYEAMNKCYDDLSEAVRRERVEMCDYRWKANEKINALQNETIIKRIVHNKGTTVVWFKDDVKVVVRKAKGDKGDVYSAVAYAIAKRLYSNNSQFKHVVDSVLKEGK